MHIECPLCLSREHTTSFGFGGGVYGLYTRCDECSMLLELRPDNDGMPDQEADQATVCAIRLLEPYRTARAELSEKRAEDWREHKRRQRYSRGHMPGGIFHNYLQQRDAEYGGP